MKAVARLCPGWLASQRDNLVQAAVMRVVKILEQQAHTGEGNQPLAEWWNTGQRRTAGSKFGVYVVGADVEPNGGMQLGVQTRFRTCITRSSLAILGNDSIILNVAGRSQEDEVLDVIVEAIGFKTQSLG